MQFKKHISTLITIILFAILRIPLYSQADTTSQINDTISIKTYNTDEITITAPRHNEVIPSQKLLGDDLQRLNSLSVADAIRYFSGIQIKDYGGVAGIKTIDVRSLGSHHIGVFYDGIQLGNAQNGIVDLGKFSLDNIEEIALYNGQKSEIFQSAKDFGSSGSIYLKTRRPTFNDKNYNLRTIFRTGSFGLINPSLLWEYKISPSISSSFNSEYINSTGKYKFRYNKVLEDGTVAWDTTATRENGDIEAIRIEGGFNGYADNLIWNAKAYFYSSERGIPGAIVNNIWKHSQRQWDRNFFTQASATVEVSHVYQFLINAKFANDYMRYLNPDTTLMYIDNNFIQNEAYVSAANLFNITNNWNVSFATDFQFNTLSANLYKFVYPKRFTSLVSLATSFDIWKIKVQTSILASFINDKISNENNVIGSQGNNASHKANTSKLTPAIFLSYTPFTSKNLTIRAFYKDIFRMPTFNDLYYTDIGNAFLEPEYTKQYNTGLQYTIDFDKKNNVSVLHTNDDVLRDSMSVLDTHNYILEDSVSVLDTNYLEKLNAMYDLHTNDYVLKDGANKKHTSDNVLQNNTSKKHISDYFPLLSNVNFQIDGYYNEVTNKIIAVPKGSGQFRWMMMNIGYVEIRGVEAKIGLDWYIPNTKLFFQTNFNYTYQSAQDFTDKNDNDPKYGTWGKQIAYIPWHNGSFTFRAQYDKWELNYSFIYVGERYHNSANIVQNYERPWYTSDVSVSKEFKIKNTTWRASVEVNNLLNQYYDVILNYPMPGRNYKLTLSTWW